MPARPDTSPVVPSCAAALAGGAFAIAAVGGATPAGAAVCTAAGSTGLTAAMIATNGQTITGATVNATGCDIGIYVGSAVNGVTITGTSVTGAGSEAILAEDNSGLTISSSTISGNSVNVNTKIPDGHAVMLDGVVGATITNNTISNNSSGGIGLADNGPVDPGTPNAGPGSAVPSTGNTISGNMLTGNTGGCAIIVEAWDPGGGVNATTIQNNTVTGTVGEVRPPRARHRPDRPRRRRSGRECHQHHHQRQHRDPVLCDWDHAPCQCPPRRDLGHDDHQQHPQPEQLGLRQRGTVDHRHRLDREPVPWLAVRLDHRDLDLGEHHHQPGGRHLDPGRHHHHGGGQRHHPSRRRHRGVHVPPPGVGYWMAGSDGGVFSFGDSVYYGSAPGLGLKLAQPIVAMAPSRDRGGYWELGADGGVLGFGDSYYYGSLPGLSVHVTNIVGHRPDPRHGPGR